MLGMQVADARVSDKRNKDDSIDSRLILFLGSHSVTCTCRNPNKTGRVHALAIKKL